MWSRCLDLIYLRELVSCTSSSAACSGYCVGCVLAALSAGVNSGAPGRTGAEFPPLPVRVVNRVRTPTLGVIPVTPTPPVTAGLHRLHFYV